jgi:hypothetical protein
MQSRFAIGAAIVALMMGGSAPRLQAAPEAASGRGAGVNFPISCSPAAQVRFNDALAGLHSFWYARAVKEFGDIAQSEPDCAIAYWGVALSLWNQLWAPPRQDALQKGSDAIQKAVALGAKSERERDYIDAVAKFYIDSDKLDHRTRARAYSDAMEKVYKNIRETAKWRRSTRCRCSRPPILWTTRMRDSARPAKSWKRSSARSRIIPLPRIT